MAGVVQGFTTRQRSDEAGQRIWSDQPLPEPLNSTAHPRAGRGATPGPGGAPGSGRCDAARGRDACGVAVLRICGRRMQGSWTNQAACYRCMFFSQYAARNKMPPRAVYLREDQVLPGLHR